MVSGIILRNILQWNLAVGIIFLQKSNKFSAGSENGILSKVSVKFLSKNPGYCVLLCCCTLLLLEVEQR